MALSYDEAVQNLTAPGAPFELVTETVRGLPMRIFKNREKSLREKVASAGQRGETEFLVQGSRRISYGEFARRVWGTAAALRDDHGLRRGDRLAILSYNSPDWLIALFAATSVGGIALGLNGWWTTEEIEYGLRDSGSRFLVVDERLFPRVAPLLGRIPSLERIFYLGSHPPAGVLPIEEILRSSEQIPSEPIAEDDPFVIFYTSGTTGRSKGCITTHRGTISQVLGIVFANVVGMLTGGGTPLPSDGSQATALLTSPLFHVGGLHSTFCTSLTAGAKIVFNSGKFDEEEVMQLIQARARHALGRDPDHAPPRGPLGARAALRPLEPARDLLRRRPDRAGDDREGARSAGDRAELQQRLRPDRDPRRRDGERRQGPAGQEDLGRPPAPLPRHENHRRVRQGAGRRPAGRAPDLRPHHHARLLEPPGRHRRSRADGWLHTGDLGYRDSEGFYFVVDRAKDMILRGGENVYCIEIENCLAAHPAIDEAAVVGVPDAELGERVKAIVRRVPGMAIDEAGVQRHVAAHLARFKVPEIVEFTDQELPRNAAGKLLKNQLRGSLR